MISFRSPTLLVFFNDTATTEIYTLSLHDALPIFELLAYLLQGARVDGHPDLLNLPEHVGERQLHVVVEPREPHLLQDRKSTRLNSSHANISYAVFCLKKKTTSTVQQTTSRPPNPT